MTQTKTDIFFIFIFLFFIDKFQITTDDSMRKRRQLHQIGIQVQ